MSIPVQIQLGILTVAEHTAIGRKSTNQNICKHRFSSEFKNACKGRATVR